MRAWEVFRFAAILALFCLMKGALWTVEQLERVAASVAAVFVPLVLAAVVVVAAAEGMIAVAVSVGLAASIATRVGIGCFACAVVALALVGCVSVMRRGVAQ